MDIGYIHHDELVAHESTPDALWAEHGWALSGLQVGAALGVILVACGVGALFG